MRHKSAVASYAVLSMLCVACSSDSGVAPVATGTVLTLLVTPTLRVGQTAQVVAALKDSTGALSTPAAVTFAIDQPALASLTLDGVLTALNSGTVRVTATAGTLSSVATVSVTSALVVLPAAQTWTFCTNAGSTCDYVGLRDVRLGGPNGPYVQQTAYGTVPCASYGFGNQDPAPGQAQHCDYGPMKLATITNPQPGMAGLPATINVPLGNPGASINESQPASDSPVFTDGSGSFRTTCTLASYAFDDPVVYPGQPGASHLHVFFGNTAINAGSTPQSVISTGNSTCRGGTLNRTGYWMPALFDSRTGEIQVPQDGVFYYKTGYNIDPTTVVPFPPGLRMIAGNKLATGPQDIADWICRDSQQPGVNGAIPTTCAVGDAVRLEIEFPQCWDGKNLDSPDHKSHMAYPNYANPPQRSKCPADHPVTLPVITEHFDFLVTATSAPQFWRLSSDMYSTSLPGGLSAHADWMYGWDKTTMETIVKACLNKAVDCGVGSIGNGFELFQ